MLLPQLLRNGLRGCVVSACPYFHRGDRMKRARHFSRLLLAVAIGAGLSCSPEKGPTAPAESGNQIPQRSGLLGTGLGAALLYCSPLPSATTTQVIGSAGGTITVGPHTLIIPAGAVSQPVAITAEAPSDSVRSVRLLPEGLTFAPGKPARLTLSYSGCSLLGTLSLKRVAYTTDQLELLQLLPSIDDVLHRRVSAQLEHFSRYAVSW